MDRHRNFPDERDSEWYERERGYPAGQWPDNDQLTPDEHRLPEPRSGGENRYAALPDDGPDPFADRERYDDSGGFGVVGQRSRGARRADRFGDTADTGRFADSPGVGRLAGQGVDHLTDPGAAHRTDPGVGHFTDPGAAHRTDPGVGHFTDPGIAHLADPGTERFDGNRFTHQYGGPDGAGPAGHRDVGYQPGEAGYRVGEGGHVERDAFPGADASRPGLETLPAFEPDRLPGPAAAPGQAPVPPVDAVPDPRAPVDNPPAMIDPAQAMQAPTGMMPTVVHQVGTTDPARKHAELLDREALRRPAVPATPSAQPGAGADGIYRTRRPLIAVVFALLALLLEIPALQLMIGGAFDDPLPVPRMVSGLLLVIGLPLFMIGLYGLASGSTKLADPVRAWLRPPTAYLIVALVLFVAAALAAG